MTEYLADELSESVMEAVSKLAFYRKTNAIKKTYYDARNFLSSLSIFLDDRLGSLGVSIGWAKIAVTALHDRMEVDAIIVNDAQAQQIVDDIIEDTSFHSVVREAIHEALTYGCVYLMAGYGNGPLEPDIKLTAESPNTTYGEYDTATRQLKSLLKVKIEQDERGNDILTEGELFLPDAILYFEVENANKFNLVSVRQGFGFIPAVKLINAEDGSLGEGTSEISKTVRSLVDYGVAQFANMRVASDAFASPQQFIIGISQDNILATADKSGQPPLSRKAGTVWAIDAERDMDGNVLGNPQVGQLQPSTPDTYIKILDELTKQMSIATRIPTQQLAMSHHDMATSAESIKSIEQPLVRRIEKKEKIFSEAIGKIIKIAYLMQTAKKLEGRVSVKWVDAGTQTLAADVDAVQKAVASGAVAPTDDWVYDKMRVPYADRAAMRAEMNKGAQSLLFQSILEAAQKSSVAIPDGTTLEAELENQEPSDMGGYPSTGSGLNNSDGLYNGSSLKGSSGTYPNGGF